MVGVVGRAWVVVHLVVDVTGCCLPCCFLALVGDVSREFVHKCEPLLCVDVDCHSDCLCLCWE